MSELDAIYRKGYDLAPLGERRIRVEWRGKGMSEQPEKYAAGSEPEPAEGTIEVDLEYAGRLQPPSDIWLESEPEPVSTNPLGLLPFYDFTPDTDGPGLPLIEVWQAAEKRAKDSEERARIAEGLVSAWQNLATEFGRVLAFLWDNLDDLGKSMGTEDGEVVK